MGTKIEELHVLTRYSLMHVLNAAYAVRSAPHTIHALQTRRASRLAADQQKLPLGASQEPYVSQTVKLRQAAELCYTAATRLILSSTSIAPTPMHAFHSSWRCHATLDKLEISSCHWQPGTFDNQRCEYL